MHWIALQPSADEDRTGWGWHALQFTPRVAWVEEALLLEVSASMRLFGGSRRLVRRLLRFSQAPEAVAFAEASCGLTALARLRLRQRGDPIPESSGDYPLDTLSAARDSLGTLDRIGCTTWGGLFALPRGGVSRRFGPGLLQAIDTLQGRRAERYEWIRLPERYDEKVELVQQATSADELVWSANRLLMRLQAWLQARQLGLLALEIEWVHGLRRLDGKKLPPTDTCEVRTSQPTQDMRHLRKLVEEHLARIRLQAPATDLRLRSIDTVPWGGRTVSLLPEDHRPGEKLHQFVERVAVRLGAGAIRQPVDAEDHRPECMQSWQPASEAGPSKAVRDRGDELLPAWLLREPQPLKVRNDQPCWPGPLQLLSRARRLEGAWWDDQVQAPALRDYFIARSEEAGLLWIFRERLSADQDQARWFLHGIYA